MAFKVIHNSQVSKIIVMILIVLLLMFSIQISQPKKVDAFVLTAGAGFAALVGIVLTAIVGYSYANQYTPTFGDLNDIYDNVLNKLSTSDRAEFIAALGTFLTTGIITENLIDQLKIGLIGNEVITKIKADNVQLATTFTQEEIDLLMDHMTNTILRQGSYDVYRIFNVNDNYLIGIKWYVGNTLLDNPSILNVSLNDYEDGLSVTVGASINTSISSYILNEIYTTVYSKITQSLYTDKSTVFYYPQGPPVENWHTTRNIDLNPVEAKSLINVFPLSPGLDDIGEVPPIAVPTDVAIDIPAFPTDPAIDTPITIPIPAVATGDNVIDVPIDNVGTVDEPIDPAIPGTGVGTLAPTMPTDVALDFSPLMDLGLSNKFPFSIPFDIVAIMSVFSGTSRTPPEFALPFVQGITLDFDLSDFEPVAMMTRVFFLILFIIALAFATKRLLF